MSKGLEALHHPRIELARIDISAEGLHDIAYMPFYKTKQYAAIEKELKENEKLLNVFKNALTIEHHDYPTIERDDSEDVMSYLVKEIITIRQSELDKRMRKALREWVLKNAFPKELKTLEIIKEIDKTSLLHFIAICVKDQNKYELLKEVLL